MKKMKYRLINVIALIFLLFTKLAWAETDLLNLAAYAEGSSPPYGENIVVEQDEKTSVKWITRGKSPDINGKLKFPVSLSGEFELLFEADTYYSEMEFFLTADEYKVKLTFYGETLYAGSESAGGDQSGARTSSKNTYKLSVSNNIAKLYINDVFSQKITLKPDLTYTQLLIQDLDKDEQIYTLKIGGSSGSTQPPVTGGDFDSGKQAGIQQCVNDPASCGITVSAGNSGTSTGGDFDSGKQAGIQQCVNDPASCGITVSAGDSGTSTGGDFDSGKQAGIQQCVADPASCGITVSAGDSGTSTGGAHATYSPATGEVHIPFIDVPGPFGGIQTYEVYLIQQPLTFAFDLDMNRINMR
jgi:hypothetical protein